MTLLELSIRLRNTFNLLADPAPLPLLGVVVHLSGADPLAAIAPTCATPTPLSWKL